MVGTSSEMMLTPFGALAAGFLAGTVSTLGYKFFTVWLFLRARISHGREGAWIRNTGLPALLPLPHQVLGKDRWIAPA